MKMDYFNVYVATFHSNQIPLRTYSWKNLILMHFSETFLFYSSKLDSINDLRKYFNSYRNFLKT